MSYTDQLLQFIKNCPTAINTVDTVKKILREKGFTELSEADAKSFSDGGCYFVTRGDSSLIAFKGGRDAEGFTVAASHTDTPAFKVTGINERGGAYASVPVEKYGGSIL